MIPCWHDPTLAPFMRGASALMRHLRLYPNENRTMHRLVMLAERWNAQEGAVQAEAEPPAHSPFTFQESLNVAALPR